MGSPKWRMWKGLTRIYNYRTWATYWDSFRITGVWRCVLVELLSPATRKIQRKEKQQLHKTFFYWIEYTDKTMCENGGHAQQSCLQGSDKWETYSIFIKHWKTPQWKPCLSACWSIGLASYFFVVLFVFFIVFLSLPLTPCPSTDALISLISSKPYYPTGCKSWGARLDCQNRQRKNKHFPRPENNGHI